MPTDITPSHTVAIKLASIAVHADELIGPDGHEFDANTIRVLLSDPEVAAYLKLLASFALTPVKRGGTTHKGKNT